MPAPSPASQLDGISTTSKGMHSGVQPRLLPVDQLAFAVNITNRNGLPRTRPPLRKIALTYADLPNDAPGTTQTRATKALFQCASFYQAYGGGENCLVASIGGRLFRYLVGTSNIVQDISVAGDLNSSINPSCWMWQAEDFLIVNNGSADPLFFDGSGTRRSKGSGGNELPAGCAGTYVQGRVWMVLPNQQQPSQAFIAGDLVYSHGFNDGFGGRAAVLQTTELSLFSGGGVLSVPISAGPVTAMGTVAVADTSLGQGALQIMTRSAVFSFNAPYDRTQWPTSPVPLFTVGLPNYGAVGARALATVNGDMWYRSLDGVRSYQVGRRDLNSWVQTPLSVEVERILSGDTATMLDQCNCVLFDNRWIVSVSPFAVRGRGTAWRGLVALDFNNISNLTTRSTPCYDGLWTGLNVLQVVKGAFNGVERCFVFALDCNAEIVLYELARDTGRPGFDWDGTSDLAIQSVVESRSMGWRDAGNVLKRLKCADLYLDKLAGPGAGQVGFEFKYRSDEDPFWAAWHSFGLCAPVKDCSTASCPTFAEVKEQYRTYLRLPEPPDGAANCSKITHRQRRTGYEFQVRMAVTGYFQLNRLHVWAEPMPDSVVTACPTSQNCSLVPCEAETGTPGEGGIPGCVGIITEPMTAWIVTEGGVILRTEDQPRCLPTGGGTPPGGGGGGGTPGGGPTGGDGGGGCTGPNCNITLPQWPPDTNPFCEAPILYGAIMVQDPVTGVSTTPGINPGALDPYSYLASINAPPGCANAWAQDVWNHFINDVDANTWTKARLVWVSLPTSGFDFQASSVYPAMTGPYIQTIDLYLKISVEYCK